MDESASQWTNHNTFLFAFYQTDDNDFDNEAMALTAFEDTYLTIKDIDGTEWVDTLRVRMHDRNNTDEIEHEQSWLLSKIV